MAAIVVMAGRRNSGCANQCWHQYKPERMALEHLMRTMELPVAGSNAIFHRQTLNRGGLIRSCKYGNCFRLDAVR